MLNPRLTDFGRATSLTFDISPEERTFLEQHTLFDQLRVHADLVHAIARGLALPHPDIRKLIREYAKGKQDITKSAIITEILKKYAPSAIALDKIFDQYSPIFRFTPIPAEELKDLISIAERTHGKVSPSK